MLKRFQGTKTQWFIFEYLGVFGLYFVFIYLFFAVDTEQWPIEVDYMKLLEVSAHIISPLRPTCV